MYKKHLLMGLWAQAHAVRRLPSIWPTQPCTCRYGLRMQGELLKQVRCSSSTCSVRVSLLLYLILPSWFLALDRGWSAMKSSPIATQLVYIYRTHRGSVKRRKSHICSYTHSHTHCTPLSTHHTHSEMTEIGNRKQAADAERMHLETIGCHPQGSVCWRHTTVLQQLQLAPHLGM